jgi:Ion channel
MTIGHIFVGHYGLTELLGPGAISGLTQNEGPRIVSNLIYFSFVTLTSTGYGNIVPIHPLARSLCNLEASSVSSIPPRSSRGSLRSSSKTAAGNSSRVDGNALCG